MSSNDSKTGGTKVEDAGVASSLKLTKRQKLGRNCKRFWWAWLIGFLIFVLVVVIVIIYGVIPPVAQAKIDDTELTLNSLQIMSPGADSFTVSINGTITGATGTAKHARLEPMKVKVFLEGHDPIQPIMTLPVDEIHGGDAVPVIKNDVPIEITDDAALDEFALKLMDNDLLRVAMRGRTKLWLGKINTMVNYNEVVTIKALNQLKGMVITDYNVVPNNTEMNVVGDVMIPNPTVVTIELGDVGLIIGLDGEDLGTGRIPSLTLRPGNNTYKFETLIEESQLVPMALAASGGKSLTIGSNGTSLNGTVIPWLSKPLQKLTTLVPIDTNYFD